MGVHNGTVDHRLLVVGIGCEMLNTRSHTPLSA